ncbi:DUF6252 family protein [Hymenobacter caeli]|uniref:DUF4251 domain-containing protein n=1 Tax=Hymenobacter caeli TaxID=2735894 RepID=A0ABX2FQ74_9BACT|nr:DUF6252 family protein [Hymenobacter caeli]NRT18602.1 hypothetical protein [Hymenobacter caeli]
MKIYPLASLMILLGLAACKKDDPEASLPAATQEGENTAGCLVNGQALVAHSYGGGILSAPVPALQGGFAFDHSYYLLMDGQLDGKGVEVMLFLQGPQPGIYPAMGTYLLNMNTQYYPRGVSSSVLNHATYRTNDSPEVYVTNARHTGRVTLTATNKAQGLSAGTFEFTAVGTQDSTKTITITNGRFDRRN